MRVLIINGSPKGKYSITLHTALYLEKRFAGCEFEYLNASQKIRSLEKDFAPAAEAVLRADLVVFCYPVYTFLVPAQFHRFVELLHSCGTDFKGRFATQITTSKHFYDVTAHEFMRENLADLGFTVLEGLSADMEDLPLEKGQKEAVQFFSYTLWQMERKGCLAARGLASAAGAGEAEVPAGKAKRIVVVADMEEDDQALASKIALFTEAADFPVDVINLREFPFKGGCQGCFNCAATGECIYKDGFTDMLRNDIHRHDAIVYAFRIRNHSMGYRFKLYDDRQFCNGHRTVTMGTPFGYIIEGDISAEPNLKKVLEARAQVGGNFLAGLACTDEQIADMAGVLSYAMNECLVLPQNFLGVGGMKIFRDLIYQMRGMMRADHKFFKSHGQYDFPQKKWRTSMMMYLVGWMMNNRKVRARLGNRINEGMVAPYSKLLEQK